MAYSEALAERIRTALRGRRGIMEKKMFGSVGFLLDGNLLVGVWKNSLIARVGKDVAKTALTEPYVGPFDVTGRAMSGWVLVEPDGVESDQQLEQWIERALAFVATLPRK